ncbi:PadR family transcriptional regulator [Luethyella okanaganae]|uniref:PadR family transcriptional regulator n=1 Tax=Luethyella okanaganae TaxID=69372 RepID=A0ABW1VE18_9MICO
MSVRSGILAILTIGPAYGFQLHGELDARTLGRRSVNVGQVYATLERLTRGGSVEPAGTTDDGLPLYRLTEQGEREASEWLGSTIASPGEEWSEMLDRVLIAVSLPSYDAGAVVREYREHWALEASRTAEFTADLAATAASALAAAALGWLDAVEERLAMPPQLAHGFDAQRPKRGRRPAA